ncbi:MAG TPA: cell division protein ZapA [Magnetospirillaceae bacterium]|jgi:cell division protein ZapA
MPATVTVSVVGRSYEIACDEGQEDRIRKLAADIDKRASDLLKSVGAVGEARILFMTALLIADELADLRTTLDRERSVSAQSDTSVAEGVTALARKVDAIAERLESA